MKDIKKMNTRELLAIYRRTKQHLSYGEMFEDEYIEEVEKEISLMKKELKTRENIPNKIEAKLIRQENGKKNRHKKR